MEKLNRAQKCSILGPQNLGSRGGPGPRGPPPPGSAPAVNANHFRIATDMENNCEVFFTDLNRTTAAIYLYGFFIKNLESNWILLEMRFFFKKIM